MGRIKLIEYRCMEQDYYPYCKEECQELKKRGEVACSESHRFKEFWSGGNPCEKCGQHNRLTIFLDGRKEFEQCCEER